MTHSLGIALCNLMSAPAFLILALTELTAGINRRWTKVQHQQRVQTKRGTS